MFHGGFLCVCVCVFFFLGGGWGGVGYLLNGLRV